MTTPTSVPVLACSLNASAAAERAERWRALLDSNLLDRTPTARGQRLQFRPTPAVADELDELVAAERDCCAFLVLTVELADERLVLVVEGPARAAGIVDAMFGAAA